jgi:hypothetical protein
MQAYAQLRQALGAGYGVIAARSRHHQAGSGEDPFAMSDFHCLIHLGRGAEVVGGDDQPAQV